MNKRTLTALQGSIKKWEGILEGTVKDKGTDNCPLCQKFYDKLCEGCPVSSFTGEKYCYDTPYEDWSKTSEDISDPEARAAAAELAFLRSLLPEETK